MIIASAFSQAINTLLNNALGSDQFMPYTAEYSWLENQMDHAMMGFFVAALWAFSKFHWGWPFLIAPLKMPFDYLYAIGFASGNFLPSSREFWYDKTTDFFFWSFGMILATAIFSSKGIWNTHRWRHIFLVHCVCVPIVLLVGRYWVQQKDAFDSSEIPNSYVRLCNFEKVGDKNIEKLERDTNGKLEQDKDYGNGYDNIHDYCKAIYQGESGGRHLIIFGGEATNRTQLGLALGCEHIARTQLVYYTTVVKAIEDPKRIDEFVEKVSKPHKDQRLLRCVIVDDIDVSKPIPAITSEERETRKKKYNQMPSINEKIDLENFREMLRVGFARTKIDDAVWGQIEHLKNSDINSIWILSGDLKDDACKAQIAAWMGAIKKILEVNGKEPNLQIVILKDLVNNPQEFRALK